MLQTAEGEEGGNGVLEFQWGKTVYMLLFGIGELLVWGWIEIGFW